MVFRGMKQSFGHGEERFDVGGLPLDDMKDSVYISTLFLNAAALFLDAAALCLNGVQQEFD
jgi:hypothetical protein